MLQLIRKAGGRAVCAIAILLALASCGEREQVVTAPNLTARAKPCDSAKTTHTAPGRTVTGSAWVDGKLVVKASDVFICGPFKLLEPSFAIAGAEISLDWKWGREENAPVAACRCERELQFEVAGLEQRQYTVRARGQK
jgi:hypothetical protein